MRIRNIKNPLLASDLFVFTSSNFRFSPSLLSKNLFRFFGYFRFSRLRPAASNYPLKFDDIICKFAKKGLTPSQIGVILRDPHGIAKVRSYDYQHYLCLLELPPSMRKSAFALRAFNVETARAMDVASDPRIGLMRLLWWQEAIDKIFSNQLIEHPVAQALASVVSEHKVSKSWLKRSVEARITDARREPTDIPETVEELERYAEDTMSTILYSTLQAGGIRSTAADHAASHIGKASGLALLLKSLPYHASRSRHFPYIPAKVAEKHGMLVNQGGRREICMDSREGLCNVVFEMASVANAHMLKARELAKTVPGEAHPVLLPAVPTQVILDSLSRVRFDVFDPRLSRGILGVSPLWYQLKLKWLSWRGKY